MTTGFFLYKNITVDNARQRLVKRIYSLLVPFWIWDTAYFVFYLIKGYHIGEEKLGDEFVDRLIFSPFDGSFWYLMSIFMLSLAALCYATWKVLNRYFPRGLKLLIGGR